MDCVEGRGRVSTATSHQAASSFRSADSIESDWLHVGKRSLPHFLSFIPFFSSPLPLASSITEPISEYVFIQDTNLCLL